LKSCGSRNADVDSPKGGIGQDILTRFIHQFGKFRCPLTQRIGDTFPLRMGVLRGLLGEDGLDHGDDCGALLGSDVGQRVAHPVDATPLQGGAENLRGGRTQALVIVGDDQLDTAQATLGRAGGDTEDLASAIGIDTDSDYRRRRELVRTANGR
jgi:hypothetical protein